MSPIHDVDLGRPCLAPARAVRVGALPSPRVRPLAEVLAESAPRRREDRGATDPPAAVADPRQPQTVLDELAVAVRPVAVRLLGAVAEVLDGRRPVAHLRPVTDPALHDGLACLPSGTVVDARPGPVAHQPAPGDGRARLRGVRVCAIHERTVEIAAVVHRPGRAQALAARLERADETAPWRMTALTVG